MTPAELILRYLDVILRWPLAVAVVGLTGMFLFKRPFSNFLSRITKAGGYGFELSAVNPQTQVTPTMEPAAPELATAVHQAPQQAQLHGPPMVPQHVLQYVRDNPGAVVEDYLRVFNGYRYERAFNALYGTQIDLLQYLASKGTDGEAYTNLAPFYEEFRRRAGETRYQMPDYVRFLQINGLIEYVGDQINPRVRITPVGLGFLSYIRAEYPAVYNLKNL
jgi:hypothetical protein